MNRTILCVIEYWCSNHYLDNNLPINEMYVSRSVFMLRHMRHTLISHDIYHTSVIHNIDLLMEASKSQYHNKLHINKKTHNILISQTGDLGPICRSSHKPNFENGIRITCCKKEIIKAKKSNFHGSMAISHSMPNKRHFLYIIINKLISLPNGVNQYSREYKQYANRCLYYYRWYGLINDLVG